MPNHKRSKPESSHSHVAHLTQRMRYSFVIVLSCSVVLSAVASLIAQSRTPRASDTELSTLRSAAVPVPSSNLRKTTQPATRRPAIARAHKDQESHDSAVLALQDLQRLSHETVATQVKVDALVRYATTLSTRVGDRNAALLDEVANVAFDQDHALARTVALGSVVPELKLAAIAHLAQGTDSQAPGLLARVAADPDPDIRRAAIDGLGLLLPNDPQIRYTLKYLAQEEMGQENRMLIEDWLMAADSVGQE